MPGCCQITQITRSLKVSIIKSHDKSTLCLLLVARGPAGEASPFLFAREAFGFPARKRHAVYEQAGDTMNPSVMGVAFLWFHAQRKERVIQLTESANFLLAIGRTLRSKPSDCSDVSESESGPKRAKTAPGTDVSDENWQDNANA